MIINANDVKTRGVSLFDKLLEKAEEVIINVRGKNRYVVIDIERYKAMRALELDHAYMETIKDIEDGKYTTNLEKHIKELNDELRN